MIFFTKSPNLKIFFFGGRGAEVSDFFSYKGSKS